MVAGWKGLPVVAALVLVGAVSFTLVAAYQWAGRLGIFGEAATLAAGNWQGHVWQGHVWTPYSPSPSGSDLLPLNALDFR